MSRPEPNASQDDKLIATRPADDGFASNYTPAARQWHTFREVGFLVLLHHRGCVIERVSGWTAGGEHSAVQSARESVKTYRIDKGDTPLALTVVRKVRTYERLFVGNGVNPSRWRGRDEPEYVPYYEGYPRNSTTTEATVVWSTLPHTAGEPLSADLAGCNFIQGD